MSSTADRFRRLVLSTAAVLLAGCVFALPAGAEDDRPKEIQYETPGDLPLLEPDYRRGDHRVVIIKDGDLLPREVLLEPDQLVAWISYAGAPSIRGGLRARSGPVDMVCHSLVNFSLQEDELRSARDHAPASSRASVELQARPLSLQDRASATRSSGRRARGTSRRLDG